MLTLFAAISASADTYTVECCDSKKSAQGHGVSPISLKDAGMSNKDIREYRETTARIHCDDGCVKSISFESENERPRSAN